MNENIKAVGALTITLTDENGNLKDERIYKNLVVDTGKQYIAGRVSNTPPSAMSHMAIGTGAIAPAAANTTLGTEVGTRVGLSGGGSSGAVVTYSATFAAGNGTGAITEAGIFNAASAGTMMCRTTFSTINKGASDTISITWTITIQ